MCIRDSPVAGSIQVIVREVWQATAPEPVPVPAIKSVGPPPPAP